MNENRSTYLSSFFTALACVRDTFISLTCKSRSPGIGRVNVEPMPDLTSLMVHGNPEANWISSRS